MLIVVLLTQVELDGSASKHRTWPFLEFLSTMVGMHPLAVLCSISHNQYLSCCPLSLVDLMIVVKLTTGEMGQQGVWLIRKKPLLLPHIPADIDLVRGILSPIFSSAPLIFWPFGVPIVYFEMWMHLAQEDVTLHHTRLFLTFVAS